MRFRNRKDAAEHILPCWGTFLIDLQCSPKLFIVQLHQQQAVTRQIQIRLRDLSIQFLHEYTRK